jgi:hypothetical protein
MTFYEEKLGFVGFLSQPQKTLFLNIILRLIFYDLAPKNHRFEGFRPNPNDTILSALRLNKGVSFS